MNSVKSTEENVGQELFDLGEQLAKQGIQRSIDRANKACPNWSEDALEYVRQMTGDFSSEEVRKIAEVDGLPLPPNPSAWGAVMRAAKKEKLIQFSRYRPAINPQAHKRPTVVWERL